ncbi:MAG TPA: FG-GAP-like repeat-containing protein [Thermoanaerobaculia bacterium]|nr:FG-GAP-like repeat-containing protein [Thermoanaerobaculia bacterium]
MLRAGSPSSLLAVLLFTIAAPALAGTLTVVSTNPPRHTMAAKATTLSVTFDRAVNPATVTAGSFRAYGRWSGPVSGAFVFSNGNQTVTLTPTRPFSSGELVTVNLANTLAAQDGSPLRSAGYSWQFLVRAGVGSRSFEEIDVMSVRIAGETTRLYGGFAGDLDHDGWLDLVGVNEVSHDLRVLFNTDDGSGLFHPVFQPVTPIGAEASPNEPADFDNDGEIDAVVVNSSDNNLSVVLGNGDGTFAPHVTYATGSAPHGVAVLDVDGDADWDVVNSAYSTNNLRLRLNNGSGVFGAPATFDGGGDGEWPVAAGDMNNDGILDLVAGLANGQDVAVLLGNGNGTFAAPVAVDAGGFTWMLALGDLNGDGNLDVSIANAASNGAILLGNGSGGLAPVTNYPTGGSMVASDLGDLDGDGDLDWLLSSFGAAKAYLFKNAGDGSFTFHQEFDAPQSGSCTIMLDFDNDSDLDFALFDELADTIQLFQNRGNPSVLLFGDGFETGDTSGWSLQVP